MARPKKQTVDYYPHSSRQGKTMFILKSKFGNMGYAFFHQLCEVLCHTEGHVINYGNPSDKEYLLAYCSIDGVSATEILKTLSTLGKIDAELWKENIIWYQDLVDSVKDAYSKRLNQLPQKPSFRCQKSLPKEFPVSETPPNGVNDDGSTESKVKKSKVKETKVNNKNIALVFKSQIDDYTSNENLKSALIAFKDMRMKIKAALTEYGLQLILKKLDRLSEGSDEVKIRILEQSIENSWKGIFKLKEGYGGAGSSGNANQHRFAGKNTESVDYAEGFYITDPAELS